MILIADSGSTKTAWSVLSGNGMTQVNTQGINPFHQRPVDMLGVLRRELLPQLPVEPVEAIHFYGAGCTVGGARMVRGCLTRTFGRQARVEVESDLLGAARALCGHDAGIACIVGTGSNSCFYDGEKVAAHTPALGYILGDEGSGAYLGRRLVGDVLKEQLPRHICLAFANKTQCTQEEIIRQVYRSPMANRYLAGFAPFLLEYREDPAIRALLDDAFDAFITRNLKAYPRNYPVSATGSVAYYFRREFSEALQRHGFETGAIERSPMEGLIRYHRPNDKTPNPSDK